MSEEEIFHQALARSPDERPAFLEQACAGDPSLRAAVEALLRANVGATGFLEQPSPAPAATRAEPLRETPGTVIGPYKLIEQIGEGGMGTVWMAQQTEPVKRLVALKLIKAGMDSKQVIARFEVERQALALMEHPNIARVLDGGTTPPSQGGAWGGGRPYFVMDLVKGVPITKYCDEHHLTPRQRLELFIPVCQAVQHAHQKGIIHRDLKPSNVLVALYDGRPVPKVIDFGVAKAAGQSLTEKTLVTGFGNIVGTLEYMSPEQAEINQLDIDTRSDIYSLGALLYELLTGSPPFSRTDLGKAGMLEMLRVIREQEPSKPSTKLSTAEGLPTLAANRATEPAKLTKLVRGELDWIVMKALEKDRNRRYETANGFAMDVQRYLANEPVQACPPSAGYRLRKFARRNRVALVVGAVLTVATLVTVVALAVSNVLVRQETAAKEQALQEKEAALTSARASAEEARTKEALAKAAQRDAVDSLREALAAVDQMLTRVGQERLADVPQMEPVRRELLEDALRFYQRFLEKRSDDPELQLEAAKAHRRLGDIKQFLFRESSEAETEHRRALAMLQQLVERFPEDPRYRHELAMTAKVLSIELVDISRFDEAKQFAGMAVALHTKLHADHPANATYRSALAASQQCRGMVLRELGRASEALDAFGQGVALGQALVDEEPQNVAYRTVLAQCLQGLAMQLRDYGPVERVHEAEPNFRRALAIYEQLVKEFPNSSGYRTWLGLARVQLGSLLARTGRPADAEHIYQQAYEVFQTLCEEYPQARRYEGDLAHVRGRLAKLCADRSDLDKARSHYEDAVGRLHKVLQARPDAWYDRFVLGENCNGLAKVLLRLGEKAKAEQACREAILHLQKLKLDKLLPYTVGAAAQELTTAHDLLIDIATQAGDQEKVEQLYRQKSDLCGKLADDSPRYAAVLRREQVNAQRCLALWLRGRGRLAEAAAATAQCSDILDKLAAASPRQPEPRLQVCAAHYEQAVVLAQANQPTEAEAENRKALELAEQVAADFPDCVAAWETVGHQACALVYNFLRPRQSYAEAATILAKAVRAFDTAATLPGVPVSRYRYFAADSRFMQAEVLVPLKQLAEAERLYREATAIFFTLPAEQVRDPAQQEVVNRDVRQCVAFLSSQAKRSDAAAVLQQGVEFYARLTSEAPQEPAFRQQLAGRHVELADFQRQTGRHDDAVEAFRQASAIVERLVFDFPDEPRFAERLMDTHAHLALTFIAAGRFRDAEKFYGQAIKRKPGDAMRWFRRADFYSRLGLWDLAAKDFAEAFKLRPPATPYQCLAHALLSLYVGDLASYRQLCALLPQRFASDADYGGWENGLTRACTTAAAPEADLDWAVRRTEKGLKGDPNAPWNYAALGRARFRAGQYESAIEALQRSLALNAKWCWGGQSYPVLAMAYHRLGQRYKANEALEKAGRAIDQGSEVFLRGPAGALPMVWWDWLECCLLYREARTLIDGSAPAEDPRWFVGRARTLAALGDVPGTAAACDRAVELGPKSLPVRLACAQMRVSLGQWEKALADYEQGLQLGPNEAAAHNDLAWLLATCPQPKFQDAGRAVALATKAVEQAPKQGGMWNTLGVAHYRTGNWKEAALALEKSLALQGDNSFDQFFLAMAHWQTGEKEKARQRFDQAVQWMEKNAPRNEELRRFRAEAAELLGVKDEKK